MPSDDKEPILTRFQKRKLLEQDTTIFQNTDMLVDEEAVEDGTYEIDETDNITVNIKKKRKPAPKPPRNNKSDITMSLEATDAINKMAIEVAFGLLKKVSKSNLDDDDSDYSDETSDEKSDNELIVYGNSIRKEYPYKDYNYDEIAYMDNLTVSDHDNIIEHENTLASINLHNIPPRFKILNSDMSIYNKRIIINSIEQLNNMSKTDNEYFKLKKLIDGICNIPFGEYKSLPISNNKKNINTFLHTIKRTFNNTIYGQNDAKNKILEEVVKWISNPNAKRNIIGLCGPPGTGKTSFCLSLSKCLDIPCGFISLGGLTDVSYLEGHSYTYEGSVWGKIADILMNTKCMNPIIFMDELDKISSFGKGLDIINKLIHITDNTQNNQFQDKYFHSVQIDLSQVLFVFSYNNSSQINPVLKDRISEVTLSEFNNEDKLQIGSNYLLSEILANVGLADSAITIDNKVMSYIITKYTSGESGVRMLKKHLETIIGKLNVLRFTSMKLSFKINKFKLPYDISINDVDLLLKSTDLFDKIMRLDLDTESKQTIISSMEHFNKLMPHDNEYHKLNKWVTGINKMPFGIYKPVTISNKNTPSEINTFFSTLQSNFNKTIFGQLEAKNKVLEETAKWISNPTAERNIIGLYGPPGTGKTSFCLSLSKSLNIPCAFISLGGIDSVSYLEGHSYTYEGAIYGKIIDILIQKQCMNPIIFMDELDKISDTERGLAVINKLIHITDTTQNTKYQDIYFRGINIDLSKILFIFSYNYSSKINPILKDRITEIQLTKFKSEEKILIGCDYLLNPILKTYGFVSDEIIISSNIMRYIINRYCDNDSGVRKLKKLLETIIGKLNILRHTTIDLCFKLNNFTLPYTLTEKDTNILLKKLTNPVDVSLKMMYL
jgi:ATP-dependent Lon protease